MAEGNVAKVPPRFIVQAASRFPRLGIDYDPVAHAFASTYLNPGGYTITVEDFPGKTLLHEGSEPDQQRPGTANLHRGEDTFKLDCPTDTSGWRFRLTGHPERQTPIGPPPPAINEHGEKYLLTTSGIFHEDRDDNAWNWSFRVPGPGTYTVTVYRMSGATVNETKTATLTVEDYLVVSIGDSAASGEGNPDVPGAPASFFHHHWWKYIIPLYNVYELSEEAINAGETILGANEPQLARAGDFEIDMDPEPVWLEKEAHRSLRSGHAYAAQLLEDLQKGTVITFLPFSRSGSEIPFGLIGPRTSGSTIIDLWAGSLGQIDEVKNTIGTRRIHALLIYIGVNDIGVASTLKNLVEGDAPILGQGDPTQAREDAMAVALKKLEDLPQRFDDLAALLAVLNVGQVYLTEYPTGLFDDVNGISAPGCEVFSGPMLNLSRRDAELVQFLASQLNTVLAAVAAKYHWIYVAGIDQRLRRSGYCTSFDRRAFVTCVESLLMQGDTEGTIHPNFRGHKAIGEVIAASVLNNTIRGPGLAPGTRVLQLSDSQAAPPGNAGQPGQRSTRAPRITKRPARVKPSPARTRQR